MNGLALCAGVGMLDEGVRAAFEFFGVEYSTVCYVEREAYAAATLVGRMADGAVDAAPVWSDLRSFNSRRWRGLVDVVTAGFPCQPHSLAGKRAGTADDRWLWPDIANVVRHVSPGFVFLENVRGIISSGGFEAVIGSLANLGYAVEWGMLSAAGVGASHERQRLFILGYDHRVVQQAGLHGQHDGTVPQPGGGRLADANSGRCGAVGERCGIACDATPSDAYLANAVGKRRGEARQSGAGPAQRLGGSNAALGDTAGTRLQERANVDTSGEQSTAIRTMPDVFAPGPDSEWWPEILAAEPWRAPAVESGVRGVADGVAVVVDEFRADQLRAIGNGVVPAQAAAAFVQLLRRAGYCG